MKKEQNKRYKKINTETVIENTNKEKKPLSKKAKISILVITGLLALGSIIGLVFLLAKLFN